MTIDMSQILDQLPPFSPSVKMLMQAMEADFVEPSKLETLLLSCPVISGRVLQISNSSFYGLSRQIESLREAIVILGQGTLRGLIYTLSVIKNFEQAKGDEQNGFSFDVLWKHSLYSACLSRTLAEAHNEDASSLFTAALFQHLGLIVLNRVDEIAVREAVRVSQSEHRVLVESIYEHTGVNYIELSYQALEYWHFPQDICNAIRGIACVENTQAVSLIKTSTLVASAFNYPLINGLYLPPISSAELQGVFPGSHFATKCINEADILFEQLAKDILG